MGRPLNHEKRAAQQEAFLAAFARTGMIRPSVEAAGINMSYHYRWLSSDPAYAARFAEAEQRVVDETVAQRRPHARGYRIKGARAEETRRKQEAFLVALPKTGIVMDAAREAGTYPATIYKWIREDAEFGAKAAQILEATQELSRRLKAERTGKASKESWTPERREAWGEYQRGSWTPEMRAAAGERIRKRWDDPEFKAAQGAARRAQAETPEARAANSERMKRLWADPVYRAKYQAAIENDERRLRLSEAARQQWAALTPEERKERMSSLRRIFKGGHKLTKIEATVMLALNDRDLPYLVHKPVDGYVADILVPSLRLVIECDGAWFHPQREVGDAVRDEAFRDLGYETLRLSEDEITSKDWARLDAAITRLSK